MNEGTVCPLCGSKFSTKKQTLSVDRVLREWTEKLHLEVSDEFQDISQFELRVCNDCKLQFFHPDTLEGSPALYSKLERFDWYYMPRKWEHDVALADLKGCNDGIEVGCGFGDFVARAANELGMAFEGYEQNPSAVEAAKRNKIPVELDTIENLARSRPGAYSAVCSFQVLEHLAHPAGFLEAACTLLHREGKLMLGLPNAESFLRYQFNPLDMPPHHMTRWTTEALSLLPHRFPLRLTRIAYEPLADYHVEGYIDAHMSRFSRRLLATAGMRSRLAALIRKSGVQRLLRGQTIYACYTRT
jgi:SAM-dependent methyltransferase